MIANDSTPSLKRRASNGFTLVELLVGVTLSGAVMAAVLSSYIYLGRSFGRLANQQILGTEARRTLAYFTKDVQATTGLSGTPSATTVALTVPTGTSTNTITYYYNSTSSDAVVSVNGSNVTMLANALTRCVYNGTTVTPLVLLRYITDNNAGTSPDLTIRYFDTSNNEYTSYTNYLPGIKQLSLEFSTQLGLSTSGAQSVSSATGTQTQVYRVTSSRVLIRNSALLQ